MDEIKDEEFVELATEKGKIVSALNHEIEEINQDRTQHIHGINGLENK